MKRFSLSPLRTAWAVLAITALSSEAAPLTLNFQLSTPNGNPVTDLFVFSTAPGETPSLYAVPETLLPSGVQSLTYEVPFQPATSLVVGYNPPGADGNDHIVMFVNEGFAADMLGKKWSAAFAPMRHSSFISLLTTAHAGDASSLGDLEVFLGSAQAQAASFDPSGTYRIIQFSDVPPPIGEPIPEPGTVGAALVLFGLAAYSIQKRVRVQNA